VFAKEGITASAKDVYDMPFHDFLIWNGKLMKIFKQRKEALRRIKKK
jgi:hypothetical protein